MRKRVLVAAVAGLALAAAPAAAQSIGTRTTSFSIAGGATLPIGDAGDAFDTGFNLQGALHLQPPLRAVGARFDVMYHSLGGKDQVLQFGEADLNVFAGAANVVLTVANTGTVRPYVLGGLGIYNLDFGGPFESETKFGLNGGGGIEFGVGGFNTFVEARLHSIFAGDDSAIGGNVNLVPVVFGVRF